jgi:hypothetical protein
MEPRAHALAQGQGEGQGQGHHRPQLSFLLSRELEVSAYRPFDTKLTRFQELWDWAIDVAPDNIARVRQGDPPFRHPPIPRVERAMLLVLAENRRNKLRQLMEELNEVERILGLEGM